MVFGNFNETGFDADSREREKSVFDSKRLNTQIARKAQRLKLAHDKAEDIELKRRLMEDNPATWIGEDDE